MLAPDLTSKHVVAYRELAATAEPAIKDPMLLLCDMVDKFRETPESKLRATKLSFLSAGGRRTVSNVPLEKAEIDRMDPHIPWMDELQIYNNRFEALTGDIRDAAFHLLWFAHELYKDREPITREKEFSAEELAAIDAAQVARMEGKVPITLRAGK